MKQKRSANNPTAGWVSARTTAAAAALSAAAVLAGALLPTAATASSAVTCIPGSPHCTVLPPPKPCLGGPLSVPSTVAQPVALPGGVTVVTTVTERQVRDSTGLCLWTAFLDYDISAPFAARVVVSSALQEGRSTVDTRQLDETLPAGGGSLTAVDGSVGLATSFTPHDLLIISRP